MNVSLAVRELRTALGQTQQAFANTLETAITTVARYETGRTPRGSILLRLVQIAKDNGRTDLAIIFRRELMSQIGLALGRQFRDAVRRYREAANGAKLLADLVEEMRRLCRIFDDPEVTKADAISAGKELARCVEDLQRVVWMPNREQPSRADTG